jgi:hypothetical protein
LILDRETKYSDAFRSILVREGIQVIRLPPRSPSAIISAWKTDFRCPDSSPPYPITLFDADSASEECSAITIGPQPDEGRFFIFDNSGSDFMIPVRLGFGIDSRDSNKCGPHLISQTAST